VPAKQLRHADIDVAPASAEYVPAEQLRHSEAPTVEYLPAEQLRHTEADLAPTTAE
jgi:hypothetical protein